MSDEFPKMLYKKSDDGGEVIGDATYETLIVGDAKEEASAKKDGFAPLAIKKVSAEQSDEAE